MKRNKIRWMQMLFVLTLLAIGCIIPMIPTKTADAAGLVYRWNMWVHDPFVMKVGSTYYMYGTAEGTNSFKAYYSTDPNLECWYGPYTVYPYAGGMDYWASEVHQVGSYYYMFATMRLGSKRGVYVLRSSTPLGTFQMWSNGPVTDSSKDCIDGTLYYEGSTPWLVYVDEWINYSNRVGKMRAVQLTSDLKSRIPSTDRFLFDGHAPSWEGPLYVSGYGSVYLTDGPQLHKMANGTLLMLWSAYTNYNNPAGPSHYCIGIARSSNGSITGSWSQVGSKPLFHGHGGHGQVFEMSDGSLKLAYHAYNSAYDPYHPITNYDERPVFLDVYESGNTLTLANTPSYVKAYWRFDDAYNAYYILWGVPVLDYSGNGNDLHCYADGTNGAFTTSVPRSSVPETGARNRFSYNNNIAPGGGYSTRDLYTPAHLNPPLKEVSYYNWTIEASIRLSSNNRWQAFVCRDGNIVSALPALSFKVTNTNKVWMQYVQADNRINTVGSSTSLSTGVWYDVVAVKSGNTLNLYLKTSSAGTFTLEGTIYLSGSTAMKNNHETWAVGRGMYNGTPTDQFWGYIDEVRISDTALSTSQFLQAP